MKKEYDVRLDLFGETVQPICFTQEDTDTCRLHLHFAAGGAPFDLTGVEHAAITMRRGGSTITDALTVDTAERHGIRYTLPGDAVAAAGRIDASVQLYQGTGRLTFGPFAIQVAAELGGGDNLAAATEYPVLTKLIGEVEAVRSGIQGGSVPGADGLSAFQSAINGGYTGSEARFYADLAAVDGLAGAILAITGVAQ